MIQRLGNVYVGDCRELIRDGVELMRSEDLQPVVVTDPPFNIGYRYAGYNDKMNADEYMQMLVSVTSLTPSVVIHYPEQLHALSVAKREVPKRVVSWVYNSNTARQHRDIVFYGINPDFRRVKQPYKNPNDKRIKQRIAEGKGARLYDWWEVNQVKNVAKCKIAHPCQMPYEVMKRVLGVLPDGVGVIEPFSGSGTTLVACQDLGIPFVGYEIVPEYAEIARTRLVEK
nr:MAG TPA: adenine specific DNA methyltransferase [Caudoviricetes sp.]